MIDLTQLRGLVAAPLHSEVLTIPVDAALWAPYLMPEVTS